MFRFNNFQGSVWLSSANKCTAQLEAFYTETESYLSLGELNQRLTSDNIRLQQRVALLNEALQRYQRDTTTIEKSIRHELQHYHLYPAMVVSNRVRRGANNYLVINKGEKDGIRPEMGIVCGTGVVGIVYLTGENYSLVLPITHAKSSISCRIKGKNYFGYLQWDGQSTIKAHLDDIPRYAKAQKNAIVETSGYSAVFPPGIFVGKVDEVRNSTDGQSYRLNITLGVDLANVRDVLVIATTHKQEINTLLQKADSLENPQ